jgi:LPS-assembly protein
VARLSYQPDRTYTFTTRYRLDQDSIAVRRFEAEGRANYDRWTLTALYGNYDAQPELGFLDRRQGVLSTALYKVTPNWVLLGGARYDLNAHKFDQMNVGVGYVDDCLILALNYITDYNYSGNATADHRVMLQVNLRTLGGTTVSQGLGSQPN